MIAYHLDRSKCLSEGDQLNLSKLDRNRLSVPDTVLTPVYTDYVSHFGQAFFQTLTLRHQGFSSKSPVIFDIDIMNNCEIERLAETFRSMVNPNAPSRFRSVFAVKQLSDFDSWNRILQIDQDSHIFEIEYDPEISVELDAHFLKLTIETDPDLISQMNTMQKYWNSEKTEHPLPELIIPLPVVVGRQVPKAEMIAGIGFLNSQHIK